MYAPDTRELTIEFVTGRHYIYSEVSEDDVQAFRSAFSKGAHFNRYIRDQFPCRKIASAGAD
jgi:KTSC domain